MQKHKLLQNRTFIFILCLYIVGFIFGLFINPGKIDFNNPNKNFLTIFFANYWYIFLIWLFGFTFLGYLATTICVFFRAFVFGILTRILIINDFRTYIIILILELFVFIPTFFFISFVSLKMSKENFKMFLGNSNNSLALKNYINLMLIVTIVILIYSLIIYYN